MDQEETLLTSQNPSSVNQSLDSSSTSQPGNETTQDLVNLAYTLVDSQTTAPSFLTKLKSRKFWLSVLGCLTGILGMINCNDNPIALAAFCIVEIVSIVMYCVMEGHIDATRAKNLVEATITLFEAIQLGESSTEEPVVEESVEPVEVSEEAVPEVSVDDGFII